MGAVTLISCPRRRERGQSGQQLEYHPLPKVRGEVSLVSRLMAVTPFLA